MCRTTALPRVPQPLADDAGRGMPSVLLESALQPAAATPNGNGTGRRRSLESVAQRSAVRGQSSAITNCWRRSPRAAWAWCIRPRQVNLDRIVALKLLPFGQFSREEVVQRFQAEAAAAAACSIRTSSPFTTLASTKASISSRWTSSRVARWRSWSRTTLARKASGQLPENDRRGGALRASARHPASRPQAFQYPH